MRRDVQEIFRMTPHEKQVMMFSATLSKDMRVVCKKFMQDVNILYFYLSFNDQFFHLLTVSFSIWSFVTSFYIHAIETRCTHYRLSLTLSLITHAKLATG